MNSGEWAFWVVRTVGWVEDTTVEVGCGGCRVNESGDDGVSRGGVVDEEKWTVKVMAERRRCGRRKGDFAWWLRKRSERISQVDEQWFIFSFFLL